MRMGWGGQEEGEMTEAGHEGRAWRLERAEDDGDRAWRPGMEAGHGGKER